MTRASSWTDEVESTIPVVSPTTAAEDRNQWTNTRRTPSSWAEKLNQDVNSAANLAGSSGVRGRENPGSFGHRRSEFSNIPATRKTRKTHKCKQDKINKIHHWFGNSSDEESSDSGIEESWNIVDRESRNLARRKRSQDRKYRQKAELALKARRMAGLGPISDHDIEVQMKKTRNYSQAKTWAVKAHLAQHYRYNQQELDALDILETKHTNKDDIVYIATANEMDIKDIYSRKAECRSDDTTVKIFIPPQFYSRFTALNRICADKRSRDESLKTQIRFGERDLIILTKEKGSQEPYYTEYLDAFTEGEELPDVDMSIKWRFHEDRPPRRRVASPHPSPATPTSPANGQPRDETPTAGHTTRQLSTSNADTTTSNKRQKLANQSPGFPAKQKDDMDVTL